MNIELQVMCDGHTIFMALFKIDDEHQLPELFKVAMKAFSKAYSDLSVLHDNLFIIWQSADLSSVAQIRMPAGANSNQMPNAASSTLRGQ